MTFVQAAVLGLAAQGDGVAVTTVDGVTHASQVVLATGAWSAALAPAGADPAPVRPIRGQLLHLVAAPDTLRHIVWGPDIYLVPWASGTVFVGATSEDVGFEERTTAAGVASLLARATALVPALGDATFAAARQGLRPGSPDDLPYVGPSAVVPGPVLRLRPLSQRRAARAAHRRPRGRAPRRRSIRSGTGRAGAVARGSAVDWTCSCLVMPSTLSPAASRSSRPPAAGIRAGAPDRLP